MRLSTITQVSVDGVMQANGPSEEEHRAGFKRDGWAMGHFDSEAMAWVEEAFQRAGAFLFGRRTYDFFADYWGAQGTRLFPHDGPDIALDLTESRAFPKGITLQVYRPAGRPQYQSAAG